MIQKTDRLFKDRSMAQKRINGLKIDRWFERQIDDLKIDRSFKDGLMV